MIEFYPQIKLVHVLAILASGALFSLRGGGVLAGMRWPMTAPVRYMSYAIDTVLLTAALMLLAVLPGTLFANGWLAVKLGLLAGYIALGMFALKRGRSPRSRALFYAGALLVYAQIYAIARAHHPLGALSLWLG